MIRVALDSDRPADVPPIGDVLLTYADLATPALHAHLAASWPDVAWIDRGLGDPMKLASITDAEPGALSAEAAAAKIRQWQQEHRPYVTAYADRSLMPQVIAQLGGIKPFRWYATLDGTAHIGGMPPGHQPALVQCLTAADLGIHADLSLVYEDNWRPDPKRARARQLADHILTQSRTAAASCSHIDADVADLLAMVSHLR